MFARRRGVNAAQDRVVNAILDGGPGRELDTVSQDLISDVLLEETSINSSFYTPLTAAAIANNPDAVRLVLDCQNRHCGGDLELRSIANIFEALYKAAQCHSWDVVETLLQAEPDVNRVGASGGTALHSLCRCCEADVKPFIESLISRGAKLDIADAQGETCLFSACREGSEDVVSLLLAKGADPNHTSASLSTPLHAAAVRWNADVARMLVEHRARVSRDAKGYTPLLWAAFASPYPKCVEFFLTLPQFSRKDRIDALELLGAMTSCFNVRGANAFWERAMDERYKYPDAVILKPQRPPSTGFGNVVESQTREDLRNGEKSRLHLQLEGLLIVERLLGENHQRAADTCAHIFKYLLHSNRLEQAFHMWKRGRRHLKFVPDLSRLDFWIKKLIQKKMSSPTFSLYRDVLDLTVQEMAVQAVAAAPNKWYLQCAPSNVEECVDLVRRALPLASSDCERDQLRDVTCRLVQVAPQFSPIPVIHLALSLGEQQLRRQSLDGDFSAGFVSFVAHLIECKADVSPKDEKGNTPLHRMSRWRRPECLTTACSIATALLTADAEVDARNEDNRTPLDVAESDEMRALLLEHYPLSLKCLAASAVVQGKVAYQGQVPGAVATFVKLHETC